MSLLNPDLICPKCGFTEPLMDATRHGLLCPRCRTEMERATGRLASLSSMPISTLTCVEEPIVAAELVIPGQNSRDVPEVVSFMGSLPRPVAMEIHGEHNKVSLRLRARKSSLDMLANAVVSHWPSGFLRFLGDSEAKPGSNLNPYGIWLTFDKEPFFPLRYFDTFLRGDPLHGLLSAFQGMGTGQALWLQIFIQSNQSDPPWLAAVQERLKNEGQRGYEVQGGGNQEISVVPAPGISTPTMAPRTILKGFLLFLLLGLALLSILSALTDVKNLLWAVPLGLICMALAALVMDWGKKKDDWRKTDLSVVKEKIRQHPIAPVSIRLVAWADSPAAAGILLRRGLSALEKFGRANGNSLRPDTEMDARPDPVWPDTIQKPILWLGPEELAGFWHAPIVVDQAAPSLMEVNEGEWRIPLPSDVEGEDEIGESCSPDGRIAVPVHISAAALHKAVLLVGKPGAGKSSLTVKLGKSGLRDPRRPAMVVIDPHGDMANKLLYHIPENRLDDVIYWDLRDPEYTLGINALDMKNIPGNNVLDAVNLILNVSEAYWHDYWGPRMRVPLQRALTALAIANLYRPADMQLGMSLLPFLLNAKDTVREEFLNAEVSGRTEYADEVMDYFFGEYMTLKDNLLQQIVQPVTSKAHRFEEAPLRWLFAPVKSSINLAEVLQQRKILIVLTRQLTLGDDVSGFVGAYLLNSLMHILGQQEMLPEEERIPCKVKVDEFHSIPCVKWDVFSQQLRKVGGELVLDTQSFARLRQIDKELPNIILTGVQNIFAFQMNGDDSKALSEYEFSRASGGPGADSFINLNMYQAWVKMVNSRGERLRPFRMNLGEPDPGDASIRDRVLALRANYSLPLEEAKAASSALLRSVKEKYGYMVRSEGGKSYAPEAQPEPVYSIRSPLLTQDMSPEIHDIIQPPSATLAASARKVRVVPFRKADPDPLPDEPEAA